MNPDDLRHARDAEWPFREWKWGPPAPTLGAATEEFVATFRPPPDEVTDRQWRCPCHVCVTSPDMAEILEWYGDEQPEEIRAAAERVVADWHRRATAPGRYGLEDVLAELDEQVVQQVDEMLKESRKPARPADPWGLATLGRAVEQAWWRACAEAAVFLADLLHGRRK